MAEQFRRVVIERAGGEEEVYRHVRESTIERHGNKGVTFMTISGAMLTINAPYRVEREKDEGGAT